MKYLRHRHCFRNNNIHMKYPRHRPQQLLDDLENLGEGECLLPLPTAQKVGVFFCAVSKNASAIATTIVATIISIARVTTSLASDVDICRCSSFQ